jgi:hypothetical protein
MPTYHLIGEQFEERPQIFELRVEDHITDISLETFEIIDKDIPRVDPHGYFITSGDTVAKANKLNNDIRKVAKEIKTYIASGVTDGWLKDPPADGLECPKCGKKCSSKSGYTLHMKRCNASSSADLGKYLKYEETVRKAIGNAKSLVDKLIKARGDACFLETEWRDHTLLCIPKNPRKRK